MFGNFPFGLNGVGGIIQSLLGNIESVGSIHINIFVNGFSNQAENQNSAQNQYQNWFSNQYENTIPNQYQSDMIEETVDDSFINLENYNDMYLLSIDLIGIDMRELSIRYDPGIIEVNLNRSEIEKNNFSTFNGNTVIKKRYNKGFKDIEDIDTTHLMKTIDNGVLKIRMPKRYVLDASCKIIDVDNYIDKKNKRED